MASPVFIDQRHWAARNSPEALADAVAAMGDGDLARSGLEASRTAGGRYSWTVVFERLFGLYRAIVAAGPNNR